tara:strand:+ start:148 stop:564 length:417 start_codon:yes stop_codon:yes gene_type:complete
VKSLLPLVAGLTLASTIVFLLEALSIKLFPLPDSLDGENKEMVTGNVAQMPVMPLIFVLTAWSVGAFVGMVITRRFSGEGSKPLSSLVGLWVLLGANAEFYAMPHPAWFMIMANVVLIRIIFLAQDIKVGLPKDISSS